MKIVCFNCSVPACDCDFWTTGFDDGDLRISATQLRMFLDEAAPAAAITAAASSTAADASVQRRQSVIGTGSTPSSGSGGALSAYAGPPVVPFHALLYTAGECNYGGRVTDDKDRLLLSTMLATCYCPQLVELGSKYSFSASGVYHAPAEGAREVYTSLIDSLPIQQSPEAFGLHANAGI
jgi:dynein heavy chain